MSEQEGASAFAGCVDLVSAAVGGVALITSDDFFAEKENLIKPGRAVFDPAAYTDRGKLMDGWESRRKRVPGHDWCILRLGVPGRIRGVDVDTAFFLGNHPPYASVDAVAAPKDASPEWLRDQAEWVRIVGSFPLKRGSQNLQAATGDGVFTHVRLNIYPDGGVARLRVMGEPDAGAADGELDLASVLHGGRAVACSDSFFSPMNNLVAPDRSAYMGGGWETRRSRPPGMDWIVVRLGSPGEVDRVVVETDHFKGNYPDRAAIDGLYWPDAPAQALVDHPDWEEIVGQTRLRADASHLLVPAHTGPFTHLRLRIYPDGGVSRLRAMGRRTVTVPAERDPLVQRINAMTVDEATEALHRVCGARRWVRAMVAARPFTSRTHLLGTADQIWWHLGDGDWLEAFRHHPRIGADVAALRTRFAATADWSAAEQSGVQGADDAVLNELADGNRAYDERFGFLFIVCATGLSADQMLARLRERLDNSREAELRIAAGEQAKITRIRLEKS